MRVRSQTSTTPERRTLAGYASVQRLKTLAETVQAQRFLTRANPAQSANKAK